MKIDQRFQRGITILELMMVVVMITVLGFIASTRFMQAKDRSYVGAAQTELTAIRQAIAMYAADRDTYPAVLGSMSELHAAALDLDGKPYLTLPGAPKFVWVSYNTDDNLGYVLRVQALDNAGTVIRATADGIIVES